MSAASQLSVVNLLPEHYIEHEFFNALVASLDRYIFSGHTLFITHDYTRLPEYGNHVVVLLTAGDEKGGLPYYHSKVKAVFKHHLDADKVGNVYHLPLPYVNGFVGVPAIPMRERATDVYFAGRSSRREDMLAAINKLQQRRPDLRITCFVTGTKFMKGWPIHVYSREMMNSKIVLSPQGAVRPECIRFSEAVKCGCGIISCKHPNLSCFRDVPAAYLDSWDTLEQEVDRLLEPEVLEEAHRKTLSAWNRWFSPQGQAKIMNSAIAATHGDDG